MTRLRIFILTTVLVFAVSLTPISTDIRNQAATLAASAGWTSLAESLFWTLKLHGDARGINGYAVLHRKTICETGTAAECDAATLQAHQDYRDAAAKGLKVAYYNFGMLNFDYFDDQKAAANAKLWLGKAAKLGDLNAEYALTYYKIDRNRQYFSNQLPDLKALSDKGFPNAVHDLAHLAMATPDKAPDLIDQLERADDGGGIGILEYAVVLRYDMPERYVHTTGRRDLLDRVASEGSLMAQVIYGMALKYGNRDVGIDPAAAAKWLKMAADHANMRNPLPRPDQTFPKQFDGHCNCVSASPFPVEGRAGAGWTVGYDDSGLRCCVFRDNGFLVLGQDAAAAYELADLYDKGAPSLPRDRASAEHYFQLAKQLGHPDAVRRLEQLARTG